MSRHLPLFSFIVILIISCNNQSQRKGNPISPLNVNNTKAPKELPKNVPDSAPNNHLKDSDNHYFFKLRLPVGAAYEYSITSSNNSSVKAQGKNVETSTDVKMDIVYHISGDSNGNYVFSISYKKISIDISTTDEEDQHYDSDNSDPYERLDKLLAKLKNANFKVTMNDSGKVTNVTGVKEIESGILSDMQNDLPEVQATVRKFIDQLAGMKFIDENFGKEGSLFNAEGLTVGKEWSGSENVQSLIDFETSTHNKVTKLNPDEIVIETTGALKTDNSKPIQMMGHNFTTALDGKQEGTAKIDPVTGLPISVDKYIKIEGDLVTGGVTVPIKIIIKKKVRGKRI